MFTIQAGDPETVIKINEPYISIKQVASILGVQDGTVRGWIARKQIPAPDISSHRFVRWRITTLSEFLDNPIEWRKRNIQKP